MRAGFQTRVLNNERRTGPPSGAVKGIHPARQKSRVGGHSRLSYESWEGYGARAGVGLEPTELELAAYLGERATNTHLSAQQIDLGDRESGCLADTGPTEAEEQHQGPITLGYLVGDGVNLFRGEKRISASARPWRAITSHSNAGFIHKGLKRPGTTNTQEKLAREYFDRFFQGMSRT